MKIRKEHIESYLPQRAPFVMIDNLISVSDNNFESDFKINADNLFVEDGTLREFGLIENIAQSSAAGLAVLNKSNRDSAVHGFMGGISKLTVYHLPPVGQTLHTHITLMAQLGKMYLLKAVTFAEGIKLIECEIKVAG